MTSSAMETPTILVVDDEEPIVDLVTSYLLAEGYIVHRAYDGFTALATARAHHFDLVILDLMLPGIDGVEVCRHLHSETDSYILMLSARSEEVDKLIGLSVGADDYLTKPFSPRELVARVKAILRRGRTATVRPVTQPPVQIGALMIDSDKREVWKEGVLIELTPREFDLLQALAHRPGHVFTRRELLEQVWGHDFEGIDRVVDVHIGTLRRKLDGGEAIQTVRGVGYKLVTK